MRDRAKKIYIEKYPEKIKARTAVKNALASGKLTRLPCRFCGEPKVHAHHNDYSKPLDVEWACPKCHMKQFHNQGVKHDKYACASA